MKRCPACKSTYTDDTLQFCLQDGKPLETVESDEQETVVSAGIPEAVTVAFEPEPETEMVTRVTTPIRPDEPAGGSRTFLTIFLTALAMLVLFSVIGFAAYMFLMPDGEIAGSNGNNSAIGNSGTGALKPSPSNAEPEPTPSPEVETPKPTPTATPETTPDPKPDIPAIRKAVSNRVSSWISLAEARNLGPYMDYYADRVDYYRKNGASKSFVRTDKQKAFSKYSTIRIRLGAVNVVLSSDGKKAVAAFDKEWLFANDKSEQTGKVRSRLVFRNFDGEWKIVSEKDTRVYYVNK